LSWLRQEPTVNNTAQAPREANRLRRGGAPPNRRAPGGALPGGGGADRIDTRRAAFL